MRVPTSAGDLYFKANASPHAFEAALLVILERRQPGRVPEVVATDPKRAWLLMRDGGTRLREQLTSAADLFHWEELLPTYAELQLSLAPHVDELLGAGVPDERLAVLPAHLEELLADRDALLIDLPNGVTSEQYRQLCELVPEFVAAGDRLASFGIPETLQHDDFHDGNIFIRDGRYLFFDWGDSCISHPFHTMVVTLRAIAHSLELPPGGPDLVRLRDAHLEPFSQYGSHEELAAAVDLAARSEQPPVAQDLVPGRIRDRPPGHAHSAPLLPRRDSLRGGRQTVPRKSGGANGKEAAGDSPRNAASATGEESIRVSEGGLRMSHHVAARIRG